MERALRTLWLTVGLWLPVGEALGPAAAQGLTAEQELELKMFTGQLADPARSAKTKAEAAELLLARRYPEAAEALRKFLEDASNRPAQIAVAEAIARAGGGTQEFIEPLLAMLTGSEPTVRAPAARALVTYKNQGVTTKLIAVATDRKGDQAVRLVTISALQRVLDKQAVDALVRLVGERNVAIRNAAAESLAKLTNIRTFGSSAAKWRKWWAKSKNKPASEWLADLAESLGREKARLEDENAKLRQRLAKAMMDYYAATAAAQQEKLLLDFLRDPLADVRLVGVNLASRKVAANGSATDEFRAQVRAMLGDEDPRVRGATAGLAANVGDPNAVNVLLARLKVEEAAEVKQELLTALGQLPDDKALGPIRSEVLSKDDAVAAAAAAALARAAAVHPLSDSVRRQVVRTLLRRCQEAGARTNGNAARLREALLTAMGTVADKEFIPALRGGLKDAAATVRLAAVRGLAQLRQAELADPIALLASDEDRGVRQAVLDALGTLSAEKHLQIILQRTDAAVEPDAAVREKAWAVTMAILAKANAATLSEVCDSLADREDAVSQRIEIRQMLVKVLKAEKSPKLPGAQRSLAQALMGASRPAEAAPLLGEAYKLYAAAENPQADAVYLAWIDALLAANDPMVVKAMADPAQAKAFAEVLKRLHKRLAALVAETRYAPAILLAGEVVRQLPDRLSGRQRKALEQVAADATARQTSADTKRVVQLTGRLLSTDAGASKAAADELKAMGGRAVEPLVQELKKAASAEKPNAQAEKAILDVLIQIAPKLTGYDPQAPKAERLARIDAWLKVL